MLSDLHVNDPPFDTLGDILDYTTQILEVRHLISLPRRVLIVFQGLEFIHSHDIAHRCSPANNCFFSLLKSVTGIAR